ncbi:MAG: hypothetical protein RM368_13290 [Nostoc sp. DedSLP03]|nr:hypothetical protein [Nostoc sp. DedSLP03]
MDSKLSIRNLWSLNSAVTFLNHGSFGACPKQVLEFQQRLRSQLGQESLSFYGFVATSWVDRIETAKSRAV